MRIDISDTHTPFEQIEFAKKNEVLVEAYSPIGHGELFKNEAIAKMANRYGVSVPQLGIRYTLQLGLLPIPKTANPAHMANNVELDFEITAEDMISLKEMEKLKIMGKQVCSRFTRNNQ